VQGHGLRCASGLRLANVSPSRSLRSLGKLRARTLHSRGPDAGLDLQCQKANKNGRPPPPTRKETRTRAHELDITNGVASFANSRSDAWHRLGQSVGHAMTAQEALDAAHLAGWNVRKMPLQVPQEPVITENGATTPEPLAVPEHFATVRTNPISGTIDVFGVVGSKYEPVQNEASCALLDALVDESGAHFETAISAQLSG
jgi:hypothetical protein